MRPVQSADEISYHEIHVAHASLKSKKKKTMTGESAFSKVAQISSPPRSEEKKSEVVQTVVTPMRRNEPIVATPPKTDAPLKDRISQFLAEPQHQQNAEGVSMSKMR